MTSESEDEPCMKMRVYYHDILLYDAVYNSDAANATSATAPSPLSPTGFFGMMVVFNDPVSPYPAEKKNERNAQSASLPFESSLPVLCLSEYPLLASSISLSGALFF